MMIKRVLSLLILLCGLLSGGSAKAQPMVDVPLFMGLNGISDWSTQHPFLDLMKSARPWIGHLPGQWGGISFEDLLNQGTLDSQGWPLRIPAPATRLEALILTDQPAEAQHLSGEYLLRYEGLGTVDITGRGRVVRRSDGVIVFSYKPGPGAVGIAIEATDPADPIRNIRVVKTDRLALYDAGARFNPDWIARLGNVGTVRFMDWMATNDSSVESWSDLPQSGDFTYAWRGVPLPEMIALANELEANPWFTLPHRSDDGLVRKFAETTENLLKPGLVAHVEYSNEMWNFIFDQARWAQSRVEELWGDQGDGWMQFHGLRAAQVMDIWAEVFGPDTGTRLRRVVSVHTGWPGLESAVLTGDRAAAHLGRAPVDSFDAYAVTGYFGYELGEQGRLGALLESARAGAERRGRASGLSRVALREYVTEHRFDGVFEPAADIVRNGSLRTLTDELWPYHADAAHKAGLDLIMYEGGTHAAPVGEAVNDDALVAFLTEFNYSSEMGALYDTALNAWHGISADGFNAFVDVAPPSKWGSWGALRHLDDDNPRWRALLSSSERKTHGGDP